MNIQCPNCKNAFYVDDKTINEAESYINCNSCDTMFSISIDSGICPKCGGKQKIYETECPKCGVIYEKYQEYLKKKKIKESEEVLYAAEEELKAKEETSEIEKFDPFEKTPCTNENCTGILDQSGRCNQCGKAPNEKASQAAEEEQKIEQKFMGNMFKSVQKPPAWANGCCGGCLTFFLIPFLFGNAVSSGFALFIAVIGALIAYLTTPPPITEQSEREKREIRETAKFTRNTSSQSSGNESIDQTIKNMYGAIYLGGHKKFAEKAEVSVVLTGDALLLKEQIGQPLTRIVIPYADIIDFGIATKEQLTVTRMLLVGILAFALKKKEQYLYVKYKDQMGFEHNPVLGEFIGTNISEVSSILYSLIEETRGK